MMNFRVGQKVVCIDDRPLPGTQWDAAPREGEIYTVSAIGETSRHNGRPCVRLVEISQSTPYEARRFRPVVKMNTDISIFTEMLKPKQREHVSQ